MSRKHTRRKYQPRLAYPLMTRLLASPDAPMDREKTERFMGIINSSLDVLVHRWQKATGEDWKHVVDAVNLVDMLRETQQVTDEDGTLERARKALKDCATRAVNEHLPLQLDPRDPGTQDVSFAVQALGELLGQVSERVFKTIHALVEREVQVSNIRHMPGIEVIDMPDDFTNRRP